MNDPKLHFRTVLIDILDHLSDNERKKLSFLLCEDIERRIIDDPTIGGTLNVFQQLFDRRKISEENFSYLIAAFQAIKCYQAAKSLRELQQNLLKSRLPSDSDSNPTSTTDMSSSSSRRQITTSSGSSFVDEWMKDIEEDKIATSHISHMTQELLQVNTNNTHFPISVMSAVTPVTETEKNHSRSHITNIGNNNSRGIYFSRKRSIWLIILTIGFVLVILAAIGATIYHRSLSSKRDTSMTSPSFGSSSTTFSSTTLHSLANTNVILTADTNDPRCKLPIGNSCTDSTPRNTKEEGLGVYYENPCLGVGCRFFRPYCRLCWIDPNAPGRMDRPKCPPCVSAISNELS